MFIDIWVSEPYVYRYLGGSEPYVYRHLGFGVILQSKIFVPKTVAVSRIAVLTLEQYIAASVSAVDNILPTSKSRCFTFLDNVFQPISNRLEKAC